MLPGKETRDERGKFGRGVGCKPAVRATVSWPAERRVQASYQHTVHTSLRPKGDGEYVPEYISTLKIYHLEFNARFFGYLLHCLVQGSF